MSNIQTGFKSIYFRHKVKMFKNLIQRSYHDDVKYIITKHNKFSAVQHRLKIQTWY